MTGDVQRQQVRMILLTDWKEYFHAGRSLMALPLLGFGIFMTAWLHSIAPFYAAVALIVFPAMEIRLNNMFYRSRMELEALGLFPVRWETVVRAKNLGTLAVCGAVLVPSTIIVAYFSPSVVTGADLIDLMVYCVGVLFTLLQVGNSQSVVNPRRESGWRYEDVMEVFWMFAMVALASVPAMVLGAGPALAGYALIAGALWWFRSIPKTAERIEQRFMEIVEER